MGESTSDGIHSGQWSKSFARSHVMSDPTEKWAGAGDDPNGSLVRRTPISWSSGVCQIAMHLDAILGVVKEAEQRVAIKDRG
eukprot:scaffold7028_cov40-Cyclotella_meneghiniana.AAC.1